ncbi:MAG: hypothetical protein JWR07_1912 [Nevskia sp.]|nr:hypothetical protein [Nevskia sp.]
MRQERLQVIVKPRPEQGDSWVDVESARVHVGVPQPHDAFNKMPPGYDASSALDSFGTTHLAGSDDVSGGVTAKDVVRGYGKKKMGAADDQYTGEHVDLFYGDAGGFCERNNYLDRL